MNAMPLGRLLGAEARQDPARGVEVTGLALHSGEVREGDLFLALAGSRGHGLQHLPEAVARGARAVAWEPAAGVAPPRADIPALAVPGLRDRAGPIAARFFGEPSRRLPVVGITGTNGKTSCTWLLAQAVTRAGGEGGVVGTLGAGPVRSLRPGERTTPDPVTLQRLLADFLGRGPDLVAMEVSSHALEQGRVNGTHFLIAVFTNLSHDHLDYHGDMASYGRAKRRLFQFPGLQVAVLNLDDEFGRELAATLPRGMRALCYAASDRNAGVRLEGLETTPDGLRFELVTPAGRAPVRSPLLGRFNAANLLAVAAVLHALGWMVRHPDGTRNAVMGTRLGAESVAALLSNLPPVPGRMDRLPRRQGQPLVVVDYAHTPDALEQALLALREHARGRMHCVFGCGGERDRGKRPRMGAIAERLADRVIVTDDNPRGEDGDAIVRAVLGGMQAPGTAVVERDRGRAVAEAVAGAGPDDVVLLAGKGHESHQEIGAERRPYSDREAALAALGGGAA